MIRDPGKLVCSEAQAKEHNLCTFGGDFFTFFAAKNLISNFRKIENIQFSMIYIFLQGFLLDILLYKIESQFTIFLPQCLFLHIDCLPHLSLWRLDCNAHTESLTINNPWMKIAFNFPWFKGWKFPGKFPGRANFYGKFPVSREAQNAGKLETLIITHRQTQSTCTC